MDHQTQGILVIGIASLVIGLLALSTLKCRRKPGASGTSSDDSSLFTAVNSGDASDGHHHGHDAGSHGHSDGGGGFDGGGHGGH